MKKRIFLMNLLKAFGWTLVLFFLGGIIISQAMFLTEVFDKFNNLPPGIATNLTFFFDMICLLLVPFLCLAIYGPWEELVLVNACEDFGEFKDTALFLAAFTAPGLCLVFVKKILKLAPR